MSGCRLYPLLAQEEAQVAAQPSLVVHRLAAPVTPGSAMTSTSSAKGSGVVSMALGWSFNVFSSSVKCC